MQPLLPYIGRPFNNGLIPVLLRVLIVVALTRSQFAHGEAVGPNVVLLMADDMGWGDPQCFQPQSPICTPHLDEMSRHGLKFNRFYAAAPVCSPTRGSCLTGRHPSRYGILHANSGHLRPEEISLAEVLNEAGYATGLFGKWHLGTLTPDYSGKGPSRQPRENFCTPAMAGFQEWFSTEFAVATWDPYEPANSHLSADTPYDTRALYWENGRNVVEPLSGCDSKIIMDRSLKFMESAVRRSQPFLAVIWFHAPHQPVVGGSLHRKSYAEHSEEKQHYFAAVTALDQQIGRLRTTLGRLGVERDTMVWFCSDNGPEGNPGPTGRSQGSAGPLRGRKRSLYEGGIRVPGLLVWPARIPTPRETDVPCVTSDFFPTVLAALGKVVPADRPIDGVNLVPLIDGRMKRRPRPIPFQFHDQAALIGDRYKLVHNVDGRRQPSDNGSTATAEYELYDLSQDPSETVNLAEAEPRMVEQMRATLEEFLTSLPPDAR